MKRRVRFRRSRHVVSFWHGPTVIVQNYATRRQWAGTALVCRILDSCHEWTPLEAIQRALPEVNPAVVRDFVRCLARNDLLLRSDRSRPAAERAFDQFGSWNPVAGFFHSETKDVLYDDRRHAETVLKRKATSVSVPRYVKSYRGARRFSLPYNPGQGQFADVLLARRTFRRFSPAAL
jgi:hypothetical protein